MKGDMLGIVPKELQSAVSRGTVRGTRSLRLQGARCRPHRVQARLGTPDIPFRSLQCSQWSKKQGHLQGERTGGGVESLWGEEGVKRLSRRLNLPFSECAKDLLLLITPNSK